MKYNMANPYISTYFKAICILNRVIFDKNMFPGSYGKQIGALDWTTHSL